MSLIWIEKNHQEVRHPPLNSKEKIELKKMKNANHLLLALVLTFALNAVAPVMAQTTTATASPELNIMPLPASVQLETGRLPITNGFTVATKGHADHGLRAGIFA